MCDLHSNVYLRLGVRMVIFKRVSFNITVAVSVVYICACSFAPIVAKKLGVGTATEKDILDYTAKVFSVPTAAAQVSNINQENNADGSRIYYKAKVNGKNYNCGLVSSFGGDSLPKCVKPDELLSL